MSDIALPDFADPPVVETVLGVSFLEVPRLTSTQIVRFWNEHLEDELPSDAERAPYDVPVERFPPAPPGKELSVTVHVEPPSPRLLFSADNHLVQIQSDWFAYNWRKTPENPDYGRYEAGRERFEAHLRRFRSFIKKDLKADLRPVQCEVTYVNHVAMSDFGPEAGPLGALLTDVQPKAGTYLPLPHEADYSTRYDIHADDVVGRLHVSARTATVDPTSDVRQVVLILTARGAPASGDIPGVLRFFDHGREWIVRGFDDLTTTQMHERWGYRQRGAST